MLVGRWIDAHLIGPDSRAERQSCWIGIGRLGVEVGGLMLGPGFCVRSARPEKGTATGLGIGAFGLVLATATMEPRTVIQFNSILCPASIRLTRKRPSPDKKPASGLDQLPWPASRPPASDPNMAVRQFPEAWNGQDNPESGTQQCHDHLGGPKQHTTSRGRFVNEEKKMGDANINR